MDNAARINGDTYVTCPFIGEHQYDIMIKVKALVSIRIKHLIQHE